MRLPVVSQLSTKEGTSNKNARLTNCLKETKKTGEKAVIRPGLALSDTYSGVGSGLIPFDGRLLLIYDDTVYDEELDTLPWPLDSAQWDAETTYGRGDTIWYNGGLYFSQSAGNIGNTPWGSPYWRYSYSGEYSPTETYEIGDEVTYNGVRYYSWSGGNTGNTPDSSPLAWRVTAPNTTLTISGLVIAPATGGFGITQTATWNVMQGATVVGTGSGTYSMTLGAGIGYATVSNWPQNVGGSGHTISTYLAAPAAPPVTAFSGSTSWSGLPGWTNYAWFAGQSSGAWYAIG